MNSLNYATISPVKKHKEGSEHLNFLSNYKKEKKDSSSENSDEDDEDMELDADNENENENDISGKSKLIIPNMDQNDEDILDFYATIRETHNADNQWSDPEFPQEEKMLWKKGNEMPIHFEEYNFEFRHPADETEDLVFFSSEHSLNIEYEFKIKRGILSDKFFIGAVLMLFRRREQFLKNLVIDYENVNENIRAGFCGFTFFINGEWRNVTIDTKLPYHGDDDTSLSSASSAKTSIWLSLLEKAYSKIHYTYDVLNGISIKNTLVDLTGGISKKFMIKEKIDDNDKKMIFDEVRRCLNQKYLIGCMKFEPGEENVSIKWYNIYL